jgi:hypothetical protein
MTENNKETIYAAIMTVVIGYYCLRVVMFLYGVVLTVSPPIQNNVDTTYRNYPELDRRNLKSQLKYNENNKIKTRSTRQE